MVFPTAPCRSGVMLSSTGMWAYVSRGLGRAAAPAVRGGRRLPECSTSEEPGARTSSFKTAGVTGVIFAGAGHPANHSSMALDFARYSSTSRLFAHCTTRRAETQCSKHALGSPLAALTTIAPRGDV